MSLGGIIFLSLVGLSEFICIIVVALDYTFSGDMKYVENLHRFIYIGRKPWFEEGDRFLLIFTGWTIFVPLGWFIMYIIIKIIDYCHNKYYEKQYNKIKPYLDSPDPEIQELLKKIYR